MPLICDGPEQQGPLLLGNKWPIQMLLLQLLLPLKRSSATTKTRNNNKSLSKSTEEAMLKSC